MNPLQLTKITKVAAILAVLTAGFWLAAKPAEAQITVSFTNTQTWPTPQGYTNVLLVERSTASSIMTYALGVNIHVDAGWQFRGYDLVSLPLSNDGNSISSADVRDSDSFVAAVNDAKNTTKYSSQAFDYVGGVRDFAINPDQALDFYYLTTGNQRSQIRFYATRIGSSGLDSNDVRQAQMFYSVNVQQPGSLAAAPEPGSIALGLTALPLLGGIVMKRRRK